MLLPSSEEMREFDDATIAEGVSSDTLIRRAGEAVWSVLNERFGTTKRYLVLIGPGNNGSDGLEVVRLASAAGVEVEEIIVKRGDAPPFDAERLRDALHRCDVVVDALLGAGQINPPRGEIHEAVAVVAEERPLRRFRVVSIDVPTGVNATSGEVFEPHVTADLTVSIQLLKRGLTQYPACIEAGELVIVDIGIHSPRRTECVAFVPSEWEFPVRLPHSHKGDYGRVLVIAGSKTMPGAGVLSAHGAVRVGAGIVYKASGPLWDNSSLWPEVIRLFDGTEGATFSPPSVEHLRDDLERCDTVIVGPGIGYSALVASFLKTLLPAIAHKRLVIDADGLDLLSYASPGGLGGAVITPHPGEAAKLLGVSPAEIERDRFSAVSQLVKISGEVVVLKGAATIVGAASLGVVHRNPNPFMASGGAGDVLSGLIGGLLPILPPFDAANWGVYLHARAARLAHDVHGGPIRASDILEWIPFALGEVIRP